MAEGKLGEWGIGGWEGGSCAGAIGWRCYRGHLELGRDRGHMELGRVGWSHLGLGRVG